MRGSKMKAMIQKYLDKRTDRRNCLTRQHVLEGLNFARVDSGYAKYPEHVCDMDHKSDFGVGTVIMLVEFSYAREMRKLVKKNKT